MTPHVSCGRHSLSLPRSAGNVTGLATGTSPVGCPHAISAPSIGHRFDWLSPVPSPPQNDYTKQLAAHKYRGTTQNKRHHWFVVPLFQAESPPESSPGSNCVLNCYFFLSFSFGRVPQGSIAAVANRNRNAIWIGEFPASQVRCVTSSVPMRYKMQSGSRISPRPRWRSLKLPYSAKAS